jgi:hypothetical protein
MQTQQVETAESAVPWREIRQRHPNTDLLTIIKAVESYWDDPDLFSLAMSEAEAAAADKRERERKEAERKLAELVARDRRRERVIVRAPACEEHKKLHIKATGADLYHVQAILMYGYAIAGTRVFAGSNFTADDRVRETVMTRLNGEYDERLFDAGFSFLRSSGVIVRSTRCQNDNCSVLNLHENGRGVDDVGRAIILAVKRFRHDYLHGRATVSA